jgi:peptidoglycan/LPS O-acetylase OafA/YrhL
MTERKIATSGALPGLTSIRFLAAIAVVFSHYSELGLLHLPAWLFHFVDGGRSAVSMFFALSGFILTFTYRDSLRSGGARAFYVARFARIYPVVLLGLALVAPVMIYLLHADDSARLLQWFSQKNAIPWSIVASLACQLLLINAWFPFAAINQSWNGPSFSVSCEAFFYAMFPSLLRRFDTLGTRRVLPICIAAWIAQGVGIALILQFVPITRSYFLVFMLPLLRIAEFVLGIGAAFLFMSMREQGGDRRTLALMLVGVATAALIALSFWQPLVPAFYLQSPFFAMLILGLALLERPIIGVLNARWLVRLGEASYSLYLLHVPIAYIALLAGFDRADGWIVLPLSVWFSIIVFHFYEEPMRRAIRARLARRGADVTRSNEPLYRSRGVDVQ